MNTVNIAVLTVIAVGCLITGVRVVAQRRREQRDPGLRVERIRKDATQFSRLLVSEIKLYNEQRVAEGRAYHDLYTRLREDIDRSRAMYDKRVEWGVVERDYFHEAIVDILCDGDAGVLGAGYAGPREDAVH